VRLRADLLRLVEAGAGDEAVRVLGKAARGAAGATEAAAEALLAPLGPRGNLLHEVARQGTAPVARGVVRLALACAGGRARLREAALAWDADGETPLHVAVLAGQAGVLGELVAGLALGGAHGGGGEAGAGGGESPAEGVSLLSLDRGAGEPGAEVRSRSPGEGCASPGSPVGPGSPVWPGSPVGPGDGGWDAPATHPMLAVNARGETPVQCLDGDSGLSAAQGRALLLGFALTPRRD